MKNCGGEVFVRRTWNARKFCPREGFVTLYFAARTFVKDSKICGMTLGVWLRQREELLKMRKAGNSLRLEGGRRWSISP